MNIVGGARVGKWYLRALASCCVNIQESFQTVPSKLVDEELDDATLDKDMTELVGLVDLKNIVRWRHSHPEDEEEVLSVEHQKQQREGSAGHSEGGKCGEKEEQKSERDGEKTTDDLIQEKRETDEKLPEFQPTAQQLLSAHATPILKDYPDGDSKSDDPKNQLWMQGHTEETLKGVS